MPRVNLMRERVDPEEVREVEAQIVNLCGALTINLEQMKQVIGLKSRERVIKWIVANDLKAVDVNGRNQWLARDVARALVASKHDVTEYRR